MLTTAATGDATRVVPAATGRPAVPLGNSLSPANVSTCRVTYSAYKGSDYNYIMPYICHLDMIVSSSASVFSVSRLSNFRLVGIAIVQF